MDLIKSKQYFKKYVSNYNIDDPKINLKIIHTYHVADNARKIATKLNLSKENIDLAELIGLLHDIGRFEQVRIYGTFSDLKSVNHAEKGVEVLFQDNEIRNFIEEEKYDNIIKKAILNHNKFEIQENLTEMELLHCKIIRDADKLDIFRACLDEKLETLVHHKTDDISKDKISPEIFDDFKNEKTLLLSKSKSSIDHMVVIIAFVFGLYFNGSLNIVKENEYIYKIIKKINAQDEYTKAKLDEIVKYSMKYIDRKLSERN